jgi:hypothetical protein
MDMTQQTLELIKSIYSRADIRKAATITTANNLAAYSLQTPAKNLYPVLTPIRNKLSRRLGIGTATNWKVISGITGSGFDSMGWVPEGQRAGAMQIVTADKSSTFRTIGEEEALTWEAISAAEGFEDLKATSAMRLLEKTMMKEEVSLIGGNAGVALGTTPTPTLSSSGAGGSLTTNTYSVICVAMSYEGYLNFSNLITGIIQTKLITGQDGSTFTLNGGYAQKSAAATQAVTSPAKLFASVTAVNGAVAYAWYVGLAGAEKLEAVTTINSAVFSSLAGTGQSASALASSDNSRNSSVAYDGFLYSAFGSGSGAYINVLATGTAGTGTVLTGSGRGSIVEVDAMFKTMWDNSRLSPTVLYVHSQELKNITDKVLTGSGSAPLARFNLDAMNQNPTLVAGQVVGFYFNPYSLNGGSLIPVRLHPNLVPGTLMGLCEDLPAVYRSPNTPNVAEVIARRDYYQVDFPQVTRQAMTGVYSEQVLAVYAPFSTGIITNIANG